MSVDPLQTARDLRPKIVELRDETEERRCLAEPIVEALREAGFANLLLERELGGHGIDPVSWLEVLEELATAEASAAWTVWNSGLPILFGQHLAADVRRELFGDRRSMYASSSRPTGHIVAEDDGYRITGRWSLVSGCMHADLLGFMCVELENGEPVHAENGMPMLRFAFVPRDACEIVDTWQSGGLRGTGSHDIVLEGLSVAAEHVCSPITDARVEAPVGRMPTACTMSAGHAAACLGVARAAVDDVRELGLTKVSVDPVPSMRDRADNQKTIARAGAAVAAARAHLHDQVERIWSAAGAGEPIAPPLLADVWSAAVHAALESRAAVECLYATAGTTALYTDFHLERRLRDIQAMGQHVVAQPTWLEQAGAVQMGLEPTNPLFGL